jgi:hypothetical protein
MQLAGKCRGLLRHFHGCMSWRFPTVGRVRFSAFTRLLIISTGRCADKAALSVQALM